jgi:hypothetical protein
MVALLVGCGLASYYCHMYLETDEEDDQQESSLTSPIVMPPCCQV